MGKQQAECLTYPFLFPCSMQAGPETGLCKLLKLNQQPPELSWELGDPTGGDIEGLEP
jgi:hypothetical protein